MAVEAETPGWYPPNGLITASGRIVNRLLYGSLTAATTDGTYEPYLAESLTPDKTFTTWTIGLRPGMTFQDGSPFDADAVKHSFDTMTGPDSAVASVYSWLESTKVIDDTTVEVHLSKPLSTLPLYLSTGLGQVFSKAAEQKIGPDAFNSAPVGAGPYKMTEWKRDSHVTMERFDGFFDPEAAYADEIVIRPIPDDAARAAALEAGDVDAIVTQSATDIQRLQDASGLTVQETPFGTNGFFVNFENPPLDDLRIREAIDYGLDKQVLIDLVWKGVGEPAYNWFPEDGNWTVDAPKREHDVDKARELVDEYVAETGNEPSVELISPPTATYAALNQVVQQQLGEVGIDVEIGTVTDVGTQLTRIFNGDFGLATYVMASFLDPDYEMSRWYQSDSPLNVNKFKDPALDEALATAQSTMDQTTRETAYAEVQQIIAEAAAGIFIRQNVYALVMASDIGYEPGNTLGEYYTPVLADKLWRG